MRSITVSRKVVTYEQVDVGILKFLDDNKTTLHLMAETKSLEIRLPLYNEHASIYVGHIKIADLKCEIDYALNAIKNNRQHELFRLHEDVIVLHDHLLRDAVMYLGEQDDINKTD